MNNFDLLIEGATVVNADGRRNADIYVRDERIVHVGHIVGASATTTLDAGGLVALPGRVESHVHFMDPSETERETFITGSAAAAVGGATTVIEHTHTSPVISAEDLNTKVDLLSDRSHVDFGLASHVWPDKLDELAGAWAAGTAYFKIFTCTTHGVPGFTNSQLLLAFSELTKLGARVLVHCEDESITANNLIRLHEEQQRSTSTGERTGGKSLASDDLALWRSREAELAAINTVGLLSRLTGAHVVVAHASNTAAVDLAAWHAANGASLSVETCPHYLYILEDEIVSDGAFRKFTPPARARSEWELKEMWRRVAFGPISYIASDHAPATVSQKSVGLADAPFGLPGVETTLSLLLEGVARGYLTFEKLVELTATKPAKLYGLYPKKGALRAGSDADIVLIDPNATHTLRNEDVVSKAGWTPFAGRSVTGRATHVFVRGQLVAQDGAVTGKPGLGKFVPGGGYSHR